MEDILTNLRYPYEVLNSREFNLRLPSKFAKKIILPTVILFELLFLSASLIVAFIYRKIMTNTNHRKRVVLGSVPLINNVYWKMAINNFAIAETYTSDLYLIHDPKDWDIIISDRFSKFPKFFRNTLAFSEILFKYDLIITSFKGFAIDDRPYWRIQAWFLKICKIKIIVIPYGSDAFDYTHIRSNILLHVLMGDYRKYSRTSAKIRAKLDYWNYHADIVLPGFMGFEVSRWDLLVCNPLIVDTTFWAKKSTEEFHKHNGILRKVTIGHFPNHEYFKGTMYLKAAVEILKEEGLQIEILVLSDIPKEEIKKAMSERIDILFDQINYVGYGLTAIEAMSCSLPVLANLEDYNVTAPLTLFSYLSECPIVSVDHRNLVNKLRDLVISEDLRSQLGIKGRKYVEKYHSIESGTVLFESIFNHLFSSSILNIRMYEPDAKWILRRIQTREPK